MSAEENKALVRRYFAAIDAGSDPAVLDQFISPDFQTHNPFPGTSPDLAGFKRAFVIFRDATPGGHVIEDMVAEGDRVVTRLVAYGRQTGAILGIPPTGRDISMAGIAIHRLRDGKIVEHWA